MDQSWRQYFNSRSDRLIASILIATGLMCFFPALRSLAQPGEENPNILLIVADDLGWGNLSQNGNREITTDHIDRLAQEGLTLERFYVCPNSAPSTASLLTGRYHYRTGVSGSSGGEGVMNSWEITLPEVLQKAGWATGCFGHWQHGANWPHRPEAQGFETFVGLIGHTPDQTIDTELERKGSLFLSNGELTDFLTQEAIQFMEKQVNAKRPFFCYLPFASPEISDSESAYAEIGRLDRAVGNLIAWLDSQKISGKTLVWFLSDNGPDLGKGTEKNPRYNAFLRGSKGSVHEGGVRVPSLIRWPGTIPAASNFRRITNHIDLMPTILDFCGIDAGNTDIPSLDGMSLMPALRSGGHPGRWPNRILFTSWTPPGFDTRNASVAVRTDRWLAIRDPRWRQGTLSETHDGWELYDLNADPYERTDLADDYPFLLSDMRADFSRWMDHTTDNGLGPVPIEIGHEEWPTVILDSRETHSTAEGKALQWPIKVVNNGGKFALKIRGEFQKRKKPVTLTLIANDDALRLTPPVFDRLEFQSVGEINLVPGKQTIRLEFHDGDFKEGHIQLQMIPIGS